MEKFSEGDKVSINDGASVRDGVILRAPGDSYFVETDDGKIWCGVEHVFAPGEAPESLGASRDAPTDAPPPPDGDDDEPTQTEAPAAKKGRRKKS